MKNIILKILHKIFGSSYSVVRSRAKFIYRKLKGGYFGENNLDKRLEKYLDYDNGFYVELGANDGITFSNSLHFEIYRNWKGILVEPLPNQFVMCQKNRNERNKIFCNACVSFDYKDKYVDIKYADLMSISNNLNLDINNKKLHIQQGINSLSNNEITFDFGSVARTLNSILIESKAPKLIDLLSLDVEGAELDVLKGIDFRMFKFKYLLIEIRDLSRVKEFLENNNYVLEEKFSEIDFLFKNCELNNI